MQRLATNTRNRIPGRCPGKVIGAMMGLVLIAAALEPAQAEDRAPAKAEPSVPQEVNGLPLLAHHTFTAGEKALADWEFTDPAAWKIDMDKATGQPMLSLSLKDPKKSAYKPKVRSPLHIAWLRSPVVGAFVMDVKLRSTIAEYGHRDLCLFFANTDPEHFYYVHLASKADPNAHNIFIVDGSPRSNIAEKVSQGVKWTKDWHTVRVVRDQTNKIEVFWDGESIMTATSDKLPYGRLGVGSFDDTGDFASVTIWGRKTSP